MLILYVRKTCPFSKKVIERGEELNLTFDKKNIDVPELKEELIQKGGKVQTPYLIDEEQKVSLYDSEQIIAHLEAYYS